MPCSGTTQVTASSVCSVKAENKNTQIANSASTSLTDTWLMLQHNNLKEQRTTAYTESQGGTLCPTESDGEVEQFATLHKEAQSELIFSPVLWHPTG